LYAAFKLTVKTLYHQLYWIIIVYKF